MQIGLEPQDVGLVITGNMAQASFDTYCLPRHVGLYSDVPIEVPAHMVQRVCGTGIEVLMQAADNLVMVWSLANGKQYVATVAGVHFSLGGRLGLDSLQQAVAALPDIAELNIPTGVPRRYTFDTHLGVRSAEYLGDQDAIAAAINAVAHQATKR